MGRWNGLPALRRCGPTACGQGDPAKRIRVGLDRCGHCKGHFTAKVGIVFEHNYLLLHKVLQAVYLMTNSKIRYQRPPATPGA